MSTGKTQVAYLKIVVCVDLSVYAPAVAGNWVSWLPWSPCSETCGKGTQSRIRLCNNPPPAFDGPQCEGSDTQTQVCKERPCPGEDARIILSIKIWFLQFQSYWSFFFYCLFQWMESGHPGWAGEPAVFHVEAGPDSEGASVLTPPPNMVAGSVKATTCTLTSVTVTPAPVSHIPFYTHLLNFTNSES